jgi:hypothetical protein
MGGPPCRCQLRLLRRAANRRPGQALTRVPPIRGVPQNHTPLQHLLRAVGSWYPQLGVGIKTDDRKPKPKRPTPKRPNQKLGRKFFKTELVLSIRSLLPNRPNDRIERHSVERSSLTDPTSPCPMPTSQM